MTKRHWPDLTRDHALAVAEVIQRGTLVPAQQVDLFEQEFAARAETDFCVALSSGTAAIQVSLQAAGVRPGAEVILPALSFIATALAVVQAGCKPVFVEVNDDWSIDPDAVTAAIGPNTEAVIGVDLHGLPCDSPTLLGIAQRAGLLFVEDACPAFDARVRGVYVGSLATSTAWSVNQTKQLPGGEGGMLTTNDRELAMNARALARFGMYNYDSADKRTSHLAGSNYKMTEITAALSRVSLQRLREVTDNGKANGDLLIDAMNSAGSGAIKPPEVGDWRVASWYKFPINAGTFSRDVIEILQEQGVPVSRQPAFMPSNPSVAAYASGQDLDHAKSLDEATLIIGDRAAPIFHADPHDVLSWAVALANASAYFHQDNNNRTGDIHE